MIYVALLRGINVGGNNKVDMKTLKATFEKLGFTKVSSFINSGNIIFEDTKHTEKEIVQILEKEIEKDFGFFVKVLVKNLKQIQKVNKEIPATWLNNDKMKCDVMFLWEEFDDAKVIKEIPINKEFEDLKYVPGAILWRIDREYATKSKVVKIIGTQLYKHITIRNCNTLRKLYVLMSAI